jgi:hypothetical protein
MLRLAGWLVVAALAALSAYGWWFLIAVGPQHGPGLELGVIAGALAIGGGRWLWLKRA